MQSTIINIIIHINIYIYNINSINIKHKGVSFSHKQEGNSDRGDNMSEAKGQSCQGNKPDTKGQTLCDSSCVRSLEDSPAQRWKVVGSVPGAGGAEGGVGAGWGQSPCLGKCTGSG